MYPGFADGDSQFWFKFAGFGITTDEAGVTSAYNVGYTYWTDFLFQAMFAATAATIVSGAVAERVKLTSFLLFSTIFVAIAYPIAGSWKWGNGWLNRLETPFYDFAGSTLVHSVGGWGALAGVILLGPRLGKYVGGKAKPILGHSMPLATIGVIGLALVSGAPTEQIVVATIALVLCLAGDVFLMPMIDKFVFGLASFLLGHLVFVVLFAATGIGNGSTFRTVGYVFDKDERGPVLGWTSAVAAYGSFIAPVVIGGQIKAGTPEYAMYGFAVFYALCVVLNWWFYLRKDAYIKNP